MPGRWRYVLPIGVFLILAVVLGIVLTRTLSGERDPSAVPSPLIGQPAPEFALAGPEGLNTSLSTADLRGRVTVLNVFASWCVPCLAEHPMLMRLARRPDVKLVGLNYRDEDEAVVRWLNRHGNPFAAIGADHDGRVGIEWGVTGVPETFILDAEGIIRFKHTGPITPDAMRDRIVPAIEELNQ